MTRINVGIFPQELPDKLLLAEHREITRIPNAISSGRAILDKIPEKFTLNTGHVKFFYDKLRYLRERYHSLYDECILRGFHVTYKGDSFENLPSDLMGDYIASERDREILIERIRSKGFDLL